MSIGQVVGIVVAVLLGGAFFLNGLIMLISPDAWFKLPSYIAFRGSLRERDYRTRFAGRLRVRAMGLAVVGGVVYVVSGLLGISPPRFLRAIGSDVAIFIVQYRRWTCSMICLAGIACGFIMLVKPKWWAMKYMGAGETDTDRHVLLGRIVRSMSLPILAVGAYFLYHCIATR